MSDWTIEQMRDALERKRAFVVGPSTLDEVCDWLDLPESPHGIEGERYTPGGHLIAEPDGIVVDIQTANLLVTVHDALPEAARARFVALPIERAVAVAWRCVA